MADIGSIRVRLELDAQQFLEDARRALSDATDLRRRERPAAIEAACEVMHDAYERAALGAGWETNPASRKPWADVPEANKVTMRAAVAALLDHLDGA